MDSYPSSPPSRPNITKQPINEINDNYKQEKIDFAKMKDIERRFIEQMKR